MSRLPVRPRIQGWERDYEDTCPAHRHHVPCCRAPGVGPGKPAARGRGGGARRPGIVRRRPERTAGRRSYEGDFIFFAGPSASREEFLRTAVIGRRTATNKAGLGFAAGVAVETHRDGRQCAPPHHPQPSGRARGAMGLGRPGPHWHELRRGRRWRASRLEVLDAKSAMLILA